MQNVKKILFVVTQSEMGGAQRYIADTSVWLAQNGYDVMVTAGQGNKELFIRIQSKLAKSFLHSTSEKDIASGARPAVRVKAKILKHLKRAPCPISAILAIREIRRLIKQESPDVLFLCSTMAGLLGSIAAIPYRKTGLRVLYRIGGWAFNDPRPLWQKKLILFLEKTTAKLKDKIIVNSQFDLDCAVNYKVGEPSQFVKIYNGIDPQDIEFLPKETAREKLNLPKEKIKKPLIIGVIANLYKTKGIKFLIEAVHILDTNKLGRPSQFVSEGFEIEKVNKMSKMDKINRVIIIGDGPERKKLKTLIEKYNLEDKVLLVGRIPNARKYLKAFDVFVLPSLKEGFPWVILEAIAAQVPIIAAGVGAVPEVIENNKSGFIVEPKNHNILAKKIQELLNNPALRQRFTSQASTRLAQFSKTKMFQETLIVIKS